MTVRELRALYLEFFKSKGHDVFPSGSLIPIDVTGKEDLSLLFNGAGMVQFKPYFRGTAQPKNPRLTTAQKCVRTGDIEDVGDSSHLTFFEMLGNFSFGAYFKKEAIHYSWEFLFSDKWLHLDPKRLLVTVFEEDEEAYQIWAELWQTAGFEPKHKIMRLGEATNYWPAGSFSSGPPGPCGPNSEMFYWVGDSPTPDGPYNESDYLRDDKAGNWLEIWNDVFIQYEWQGHLADPSEPAKGYIKDGLAELPFQSIDTGMGLDRTAMALAGLKTVYDNDAFAPILKIIQEISGHRYGTDETKDRAVRIIADHIRTSVFCIADGVLPGNGGREYVLRRLIRRAVLKGQRTLKIQEAFFHKVYEGVAISMGDHYAELSERRGLILDTLQSEEALFRRTVAAGNERLNEILESLDGKVLPGEKAFDLYHTYGFPLEVTREVCQEHGVTLDEAGYKQALEEAQELSRKSSKMEAVYGEVALNTKDVPKTDFLGYAQLESEAKVLFAEQAGSSWLVALDQTPFYATSGGQLGDHGTLEIAGETRQVTGVTKREGVFLHVVSEGKEIEPGALVVARVDTSFRKPTQRNHTATHLLQAALQEVLGKGIGQAGSEVGPDALRFDFTYGKAMTPEEIGTVERRVNEQILLNTDVVTYVDIPIGEAKARGAMALFGEKYGAKVRMVEIGEFSRELCGGTHVRTTGEIGLFKIKSESSAASGIRRIEAITGEKVYQWMNTELDRTRQAAQLLKSSPSDLVSAISHLQDQLKEEKRKREAAETKAIKGGNGQPSAELETIGNVKLWLKRFDDMDPKSVAVVVDDQVARDPAVIAFVAIVQDGKIQYIAKAGTQAVASGVHAGQLATAVAKQTGGGGGGRAEFATAGGKQLDAVPAALSEVPELLRAQLGVARN